MDADSIPQAFGRFADAAYGGFLEVVLAGRFTVPTSNWTRLARLAGLGAAFLIAWEAIRRLFARPIRNFYLRWHRKHVILFGLGRVGMALARDLTKESKGRNTSQRRRVVAVELSPTSPHIKEAERLGVLVIEGSATDQELQRLVRVEHADTICMATGSDEINLEVKEQVVQRLAEQLTDRAKGGRRLARMLNRAATPWPRVLVHLKNRRLSDLLNWGSVNDPSVHTAMSDEIRKEIATRTVDEVVSFNLLDRSIAKLLNGPVIERRPRKTSEVLHAVIVGFGEVGQALALAIGNLAQYENDRRTRMTILYEGSEEKSMTAFLARYPQFFPDPNEPEFAAVMNKAGLNPASYNPWMPHEEMDHWAFGVHVEQSGKGRGCTYAVNGGFYRQQGGCAVRSVVDRVIDLCKTKDVRPMVFLCQDQDEENCVDAKLLRDELDTLLKVAVKGEPAMKGDPDHRVTVFPYVPFRPTLHAMVNPRDKNSADLIPWGNTAEICRYNALRSDLVYEMAVTAFANFPRSETDVAGDSGRQCRLATVDAINKFENTRPWERHSNLMAAAHWNSKLAIMNLRLEDDLESDEHQDVGSDFVPTNTDHPKKLMAIMEHNRWVAERLLQNWQYGERAPKDSPENCRRLTMVDWENVENWEQEKDYIQIEALLEYCRVEMSKDPRDRRFRLVRLRAQE
jgi:hypothetical protein